MRLFALLTTAALTAGCAHRGIQMPGPTHRMGHTPPAYADTLEAAPADAPPAEVAAAPAAQEQAEPPPARQARRRRGRSQGEAVAQGAAELLGKRKMTGGGQSFRYDCSGMVAAAHARAGTDLSGSSRNLFDQSRQAGVLHRKKVPHPGDVAFFDDTYDRNNNRRRDDDLTHVAVVESVAGDGTITLVHKGSKGVVRIEMNLKRPHDRRDEAGRELNDHLRAASARDNGPTLTAELWRAFGSLWAVDDRQALASADAE